MFLSFIAVFRKIAYNKVCSVIYIVEKLNEHNDKYSTLFFSCELHVKLIIVLLMLAALRTFPSINATSPRSTTRRMAPCIGIPAKGVQRDLLNFIALGITHCLSRSTSIYVSSCSGSWKIRRGFVYNLATRSYNITIKL